MPRFEIGDCPKGSKDSRIHDRGRKVERWKTRGELEAYWTKGEGRMDWKEGKERERETAIIVGNGWGMDAVIWRCMHHRLCHLTRDDRPT